MKTVQWPSVAARCIAASLIGSLLLAPLSQAVELADSPMAVQSYASPNIMFTLDDSTSMRGAYSHFSSMQEIADGDYIPLVVSRRCTKNSIANNLYYNPNTTYTPGLRADGQPYPNSNFYGALINGYKPGQRYSTFGTNEREYPSASRDAYNQGYQDGSLVDRQIPGAHSAHGGIVREPANQRNDGNYGPQRLKDAYNRGYDHASRGEPNRQSDYVYTYFLGLPNDSSAPVNLATSFQAYFDEGSMLGMVHDKGPGLGRHKLEYQFSPPRSAYYTRYVGSASPETGRCYPDSDYVEVEITSDAERQNFANWFSYHRTRTLVMQTAVSIAFNGLGEKYRIGFGVLNEHPRKFLPIRAFRSCGTGGTCHKDRWYETLFSITRPSGGTPLMQAAVRAGEYFKTGRMPGTNDSQYIDPEREPDNDPSNNEDDDQQTDPIIGSCQRNFHVLSTDGFASIPIRGDAVGDTDRRVPSLGGRRTFNPITKKMEDGVFDPVAGTMLVPGQPFPPPYFENTAPQGSFLSDIGMYYWVNDLRPGMEDNVPPSDRNPATWQHVSLYTVGFGLSGQHAVNDTNFQKLVKGELQWPTPVLLELSMMDDMWHAAINGHGQHFTATNADQLQQGLSEALSDAVTLDTGSAAVAVSNPDLASGDRRAFGSRFNSGTWSGSLRAYLIDPETGMVDNNSAIWAADQLLNARDWGDRFIASYSGSAGVAFSTAGLTDQQKQRLNSPGMNDHPDVIAFLRGDASKEGKAYRRRGFKLGDIVNAAPLYVGPPTARYGDTGHEAFRIRQANRTKMVYQGANDGMLHAFNADNGEEQWAYVPGRLIWQDYVTSARRYPLTSTLVNLSLRKGFSHRYYVDGTPAASDVDLNNTFNVANRGTAEATPEWATLLVGGLNKGGRGYYALDITSPAASSDADVARKVKWEFPAGDSGDATSKNVGFSFGKPIIVKTNAAGWVVLVTSGYNNGKDTGGDGQGYLFVLDAATGNIIKTLSTNVGSSDTPSGLAHLSGYIEFGELDRTVQYAYGGDLLGNVWRFDLRGSNVSDWNVRKLATLTDASGNPQPVTTAPELTKIGDTRLVLVGTGQYLGLSDVPGNTFSNAHALQTQSFYVMTDDLGGNPTIGNPRSQLQQQTITVSGNTASISKNPVDLATKRGWYVDFPQQAERSVTHPFVVRGVVAFTSNIPGPDTCKVGGSSWLYVLNVKNGYPIEEVAGRFLGTSLASEVVPVRESNGAIRGLIRRSDGTTATENLTQPNASRPQRKMWREVLRK